MIRCLVCSFFWFHHHCDIMLNYLSTDVCLTPCRTEKEPPSTLMWALFLLAQVVGSLGCLVCFFFCFTTFSFTPLFIFFGNFLINFLFIQHYDRRGQYDISLSKIDEAIEHTPTVIDLYSVKVSVYYKLSFFKLLILYILWLITSMVLHYW